MGNELAFKDQPVIDWFHGPGDGLIPAMLEPDSAEVREQAKPGPVALPEVQFGQGAERINPTSRELRFIVPLTVDQTYLGDVELAVSPQDVLSLDAPRLLQLLKPIVDPAVYNRLAALADAKGRLDQNALAKEGIGLAYNSRNLALTVDIPVKQRQSRSLSLGARADSLEVTLQPAAFSAYINVHAAAELVEAGSSAGLVPPTAALDGALRIHGVVVESEGYVSARSSDPVFRRTGSRLIYDDMRHMMRWTLGDAQTQARQFQASPTVMGLGISRIYSQIDPQHEIRSGGAQTFSVLSPSIIETFVNGRSMERRSFQPGNYTLQDFPLAEGTNAVKLRVEDSSGKVRTIDFSVYANQSLLARGVTEFSAFGGVYSTPSRNGFSYSREWIGGGFVRTGLNEQLTAAINVQTNRQTRQIGAEILWGSPVGLTGFNLTASNNSQIGTGLAAAITYEHLLSPNGGARSQSIRASIEWRSKRFAFPDVAFGQDRTELRASAGYVMTLGGNGFIAADGQYSRDRVTRDSRYGARLSGGFDVNRRLTANAEIGVNRGNPRNETYVRFGLRMRFGERGTVQADADSNGRARASYSNSGGNGNGAWLTSADMSHDRDSVSLNANASMTTNRAEIGVQQTAGWDRHGMRLTDARMSVHAAFALAFADGAFAVGRPISEAFVIARAHRSLGKNAVYLDPVEQSEAARSGSFGPALVGQLSAHNFRTLIYQVPDAPSGYDLGAGNIAIKPPYRGGYGLVIGSDYHLLVIGRLLDRNGEPVKLLAGKAIDLGNPKHPALTIFTSRDGRFGAQGLRPGRWRFEMPTEQPTAYEFEVSDSADGIVRIGELRPMPPKGE